MLKIRYVFIVLGMLLYSVPSPAQVSIGIGFPNVSIGINLPIYPELVPVPGYPVYYAPRLQVNFFFYDGMYWVYQDDNWYESTWYNGPWWLVQPEFVPVFILRIPVRYYRHPPAYFRGWRSDAPPRWGDHWGRDWERRRSGWDRWDRGAAPAPAPLPLYQRQYSGGRYPRQVEQQHELQQRNYRYQPRDPIVQQQYQEQALQRPPVQQERQGPQGRGSRQQDIQRSAPRPPESQVAPRFRSPQERGVETAPPPPPVPARREPAVQKAPEDRGSRRQDIQRSAPRQQDIPAPPQAPQGRGFDMQRSIPASPQPGRPEVQDRQPSQPGAARREQQMPRSQGREERQQGRDAAQEQRRGQGQEQGQGRGRDRDE